MTEEEVEATYAQFDKRASWLIFVMLVIIVVMAVTYEKAKTRAFMRIERILEQPEGK